MDYKHKTSRTVWHEKLLAVLVGVYGSSDWLAVGSTLNLVPDESLTVLFLCCIQLIYRSPKH